MVLADKRAERGDRRYGDKPKDKRTKGDAGHDSIDRHERPARSKY